MIHRHCTCDSCLNLWRFPSLSPAKLSRRRGLSYQTFRFRSTPRLLPDSLQPLGGHRARSIGALIGKNTRAAGLGGGGGRRGNSRTDGRKRVSEKRYLRPAHQTLFHGGDPPRSIPVRKGHPSLFLLSFLLCLSSLVTRAAIAKTSQPLVKGDPTKSPTKSSHVRAKGLRSEEEPDEGEGEGGGRFTDGWMGDENHEADGALLPRTSRHAEIRRKSSKEKYAKQRPSLPRPFALRSYHPSLVLPSPRAPARV